MIKHFKEISKTEMEIMTFLWKQKEAVSTSTLLSYFNNEKQKAWKTQTISTFLTRLANKGFVLSEHMGRGTVHSPAISPEDYNQFKANSILKNMYKGSIKNFLVALYGDKKLSNEEVDELKKWLSER